MHRRTFLRGTAALGLSGGLAGCSGLLGSTEPPARKAWLFEDVAVAGTQMTIDVDSNPQVESRKEPTQNAGIVGMAAAGLPVGVARGAKGKGGRGSGGYSSAPNHHRHGRWAVWHGGGHNSWRDDHEDELKRYPAAIETLGVAYLGSDAAYEQDPPGPGPSDVSWDRTWEHVSDGATKTVDLSDISPSGDVREGWYRVGTELTAENDGLDFEWQSVDFEIDKQLGTEVDKAWYVAPRV